MRPTLGLVAIAALCAAAHAQTGDGGTAVDATPPLAAPKDGWPSYHGDYSGQRHSALTQITPDNVKTLELQWVFQARSIEKFEATALVVDGVMYTVQAPNDIVALDATTGRTFWQYSYRPAPESRPCCGRVNRGVAILGDTLFMGTIDGHLVAVDAKTGSLIWDTAVAKPEAGYSLTHAPLVVKDKVIVGTAGGEYGIRGFVAAYDAKTGKEAWRFNTIPGPGEPGHDTWAGDSWKRGGGPIWVTGSYDRELNLTYWGVGNPGPDFNGDVRLGDNLYTDSVIALDADTGQLKWYYQFSPHDEFDYDSTQVPVLTDLSWNGRPRKVLMFGNRNGIFYVLDRTTGEFLLGKPFVKVTWADGFDAKGRPQRVPGMASNVEGVTVFPGNQGGTNWYNPAFSPRTGLFYIPAWVNYSTTWVKTKVDFVEGRVYTSGIPRFTVPRDLQSWQRQPVNQRKEDEGYGAVRAIDPHTGDLKWEYKMTDFTDGGILTTASDLVFTGGREGFFVALNARTGVPLWKFSVGGVVASGPMTYSVGGRQYVAVAAGNSLFAFALHQ